MSDLTLTARSPLDGYSRDFDGTALAEVSGLALVSIATPLGGEENLARSVETAFGASPPKVGSSIYTKDDDLRLLGLQRGQLFVLFEYGGDDAVAAITKKLGDAGYYTDQSDSWAILRLSGPNSRRALQRICMLDLSPERFLDDTVSRTTMEHLGVIILRDGADSFILMSPRSSARSFLHALETSIFNTT